MKQALVPAFLAQLPRDELPVRRRLRHLEHAPRPGRRHAHRRRPATRSTPSATTTSSTPAKTSTPSSSPPPTSSTRSTASKPSTPAATPTSKSPRRTPWTTPATSATPCTRPARSCRSARSAARTPSYQKAYEYIKSGEFGDIVMVEMTWNVNQPGRWRRPDVVPLLKEAGHRLEPLPAQPAVCSPSTRASTLSSASSGRTPPASPTSGSSTRSTPCTGSPGYPHPRTVVANGGIYAWQDGRVNWDTLTAVFDYGPLDDLDQGLPGHLLHAPDQRGRRREGALLLHRRHARHGQADGHADRRPDREVRRRDEDAAQPAEALLARATGGEGLDRRQHRQRDPQTCANMRNWMECVRSRKTPNASIEAGYSHSIALCMCIAAMQTGAARHLRRQDAAGHGGRQACLELPAGWRAGRVALGWPAAGGIADGAGARSLARRGAPSGRHHHRRRSRSPPMSGPPR